MDNHPQITLSGYFPYRPWGASPNQMLGIRIGTIIVVVIADIVCVALLVRFVTMIPSAGVTDAVVALLALCGVVLLSLGLVFFPLTQPDIVLSPAGIRLQKIGRWGVLIPWEALRGMTITEFTDVPLYDQPWGLMPVWRMRTHYVVYIPGLKRSPLFDFLFRRPWARPAFVVTSDHEGYKLLLKQLTQAAIWQEGLSASKDNL